MRAGLALRVVTTLTIGAVVLPARTATAAGVAFAELAGEPDVRAEAGAITLVARSLLAAAGQAIVAENAAPDLLVRGSVWRQGTQLAIMVRATNAKGATAGSWRITAPSGDVSQAGQAAALKIGALLNATVGDAPPLSLAELRPFVAARDALSAGDIPAAVAALDESDPALKLSDAELIRAEVAAKAGPRDPSETQVAAAVAAHERGDGGTRDALLGPLIARSSVPALRLVATLPPAVMAPALEGGALAAAAALALVRPGLSSRLAYRAALGGADASRAMPLIRAAEHSRGELERLVPFLDAAVTAQLPASVRLRAELRMLAGDRAGAEADLRASLTSDPRDRIALHDLARILTDKRDYTGAVTALKVSAESGDVNVRRELARAMILAGDKTGGRSILVAIGDPKSAETRVAQAAQAQETGLTREALEHLAAARQLSPDDPENLRALAEIYKKSGDVAHTVELLGLAERLGEGEAVSLATEITGLPVRAAEEVALPAQAPTAGRAIEVKVKANPLQGEIEKLLLGFDILPQSAGKRVLVVERADARPSPLSPLRTHPDVLAETLAKALAGPPFRTMPVVARGSNVRAALDTLQALSSRDGAERIVLYDLSTEGLGNARVRLLVFDAPTGRSFELSRSVDGMALDLVSVKPVYLATVLLLLAALLGWVVWVIFIGSGEIDVSIKNDPETTVQLYDLVISRRGEPPAIPDIVAWVAEKQGTPPARTNLRATHVGLHTRFVKVTTGHWFIHLIGAHEKASAMELLPPQTQPVKVPRRGMARVNFDLIPTTAEVRVTVFDGDKPLVSARIAVDDKVTPPTFTNPEGTAILRLPKGQHMLLIKAGGMNLERKLQLVDTRSRTVSVNVERERRLASIGDVRFHDEPSDQEPLIDHSMTPGAGGTAMREVNLEPAPAGPAPALGKVRKRTLQTGEEPPQQPKRPTLSITGLSRYQPIDEIGRGAMATVFRARDTVLERDVALKMISDEVRQYPVALQLFLQEGKALAALNHPNIVTVFDQGRDGDQYYIVMELVSGTTLERLMETRGGLKLAEALDTIDQLCSGLSYAHSRRVVHRDIKPGNIFINEEGVVKLGDFGLARVVNEVKIKRTDVRGTPLYMAPEQIRGADIDFRADLYSVGCTLFELLTGQAPFSVGEILYHHLHTAPPKPSDLVPALPEDLDSLVMSCLQKDARDRVGSADAIRAALKPLIRKYAPPA